MTEILPFHAHTKCPKCGRPLISVTPDEDVDVRWLAAEEELHQPAVCGEGETVTPTQPERLLMRCHCHYSWETRAKDYGEWREACEAARPRGREGRTGRGG